MEVLFVVVGGLTLWIGGEVFYTIGRTIYEVWKEK